jgi:hypothetical protein
VLFRSGDAGDVEGVRAGERGYARRGVNLVVADRALVAVHVCFCRGDLIKGWPATSIFISSLLVVLEKDNKKAVSLFEFCLVIAHSLTLNLTHLIDMVPTAV